MLPRIVAFLLSLLIFVSPVHAQTDVPSDAIFGFTAPVGIGDPGDRSITIEATTRMGKGQGSFSATSIKHEFGYVVSDRLWIAVSPFSRVQFLHGLPAIDRDHRTIGFDGFSTEWVVPVLARLPGFPLAAALSFEPAWNRLDPMTGRRGDSLGAEMKLFLDAPLSDDVFWAANLNYDPTVTRVAGKWSRSATTNASTGLTVRPVEGLFLGGEGRLVQAFTGYGLTRPAGRALFLGPTIGWEPVEGLFVNAT